MLEAVAPTELAELLRQGMAKAGNAKLMTPELVITLSEHASGNVRTLMHMADELLAVGTEREVQQLDEKLYLEVFAVPASPRDRAAEKRGRRR